jgi:hypothetical protein
MQPAKESETSQLVTIADDLLWAVEVECGLNASLASLCPNTAVRQPASGMLNVTDRLHARVARDL